MTQFLLKLSNAKDKGNIYPLNHTKPFLLFYVTVHELTPFDIKVVAAVGDSITVSTM